MVRAYDPLAYGIRTTRNKRQSVYFDEMPENAFEIEEYMNYYFENYWYDPDRNCILLVTRTNRIKLVQLQKQGDHYSIVMTDCDGRNHHFGFRKLNEYLSSIYDGS